jgi:hypothetical protein
VRFLHSFLTYGDHSTAHQKLNIKKKKSASNEKSIKKVLNLCLLQHAQFIRLFLFRLLISCKFQVLSLQQHHMERLVQLRLSQELQHKQLYGDSM